MGDPGRTPVINSQVYAGDLRRPHRACFPVRREIGLGAVVAVPHIMDGDLIAIDLCPSSLCNVRLPRAIIAGLQRKPPRNYNCECPKYDCEFEQFPANEYHDRQDSQQKGNRCERARLWKIKIESSKRPCCANESRQPCESP